MPNKINLIPGAATNSSTREVPEPIAPSRDQLAPDLRKYLQDMPVALGECLVTPATSMEVAAC